MLTTSARRGLASEAFRWAIAPSLLAWAGLTLLARDGAMLALCATAPSGFWAGVPAAYAAFFATSGPGVVVGWGLMLTAMMPPLLIPAISFVSARSFADRRDRSVGLFLVGYTLLWGLAAAMAFLAIMTLGAWLHPRGLAVAGGLVGCAAAAAWQLSPSKRRALNRCHQMARLRASGWAADRDALVFGLSHGARCLAACGPTMFLTMVSAHGLLTTIVVFFVLLGERTGKRPRQAGAAVLILLSGIVGSIST